jgi:hypothetical protein
MTSDTKKHNVYVLERNWAEFDAAGREPAGLDDPAMYFQAICVRGQKIGWEDALTEFEASRRPEVRTTSYGRYSKFTRRRENDSAS